MSLWSVWRAVSVSALLLAASPAVAQDDGALVERGRRIFEAQGCYACHAVGDVGATTAPNLSRVGARYSPEYLTYWLRNTPPRGSMEHMPKIRLAEPEIQALAAFLSSLRGF
jgi:mono/diheme cytochrome c family protein